MPETVIRQSLVSSTKRNLQLFRLGISPLIHLTFNCSFFVFRQAFVYFKKCRVLVFSVVLRSKARRCGWCIEGGVCDKRGRGVGGRRVSVHALSPAAVCLPFEVVISMCAVYLRAMGTAWTVFGRDKRVAFVGIVRRTGKNWKFFGGVLKLKKWWFTKVIES